MKRQSDICWYQDVCSKVSHNCSRGCIRFLEMTYMLEHSNIPKDKWQPIQLSPGRDKLAFLKLKKLKDNIYSFVQEGKSVYIYSDNFGNGKTSWAIRLLLAYFDNVWAGNGFRRRGMFINVPSFFKNSKLNISKHDEDFHLLLAALVHCDVVVWDDIASTKLSDYDHSLLLAYIDERKIAGKANIYTGNANQEQVLEYLGGRLSSRVWNDSQIVELVDADKRGVGNG